MEENVEVESAADGHSDAVRPFWSECMYLRSLAQ
jgi:hypothetical protein